MQRIVITELTTGQRADYKGWLNAQSFTGISITPTRQREDSRKQGSGSDIFPELTEEFMVPSGGIKTFSGRATVKLLRLQ